MSPTPGCDRTVAFDPDNTTHAIMAYRALDAARLLRHDPITAIEEVLGWNHIEASWSQIKDFIYKDNQT